MSSIYENEIKKAKIVAEQELLSLNERIEGAETSVKYAEAFLNSLKYLKDNVVEHIKNLDQTLEQIPEIRKKIIEQTIEMEQKQKNDRKLEEEKEEMNQNPEKKTEMCSFNEHCFWHPEHYKNPPIPLFSSENINTLYHECYFKHTKPPLKICRNPVCTREKCKLLHAPISKLWCNNPLNCVFAPCNIEKINKISKNKKKPCLFLHATKEYGFKELCSHVYRNNCSKLNCTCHHILPKKS
jgi:hypothetical protein